MIEFDRRDETAYIHIRLHLSFAITSDADAYSVNDTCYGQGVVRDAVGIIPAVPAVTTLFRLAPISNAHSRMQFDR